MIPDLQSELARRFQRPFDSGWQRLTGGYESDVWRVGDVVVRISPAWRTDAELRWMHNLVRHCAQTIPQVVAPLVADDGATLFRWQGRPVTVLPYVSGMPVDREDDAQMEQAAALLARIHLAGLRWPGIRPRPPHSQTAPAIPRDQPDPPAIQDGRLDRWYIDVFQRVVLLEGPVHGDYYRGNILWGEGGINGVLDWDESTIQPLITETAWAMWEFTHNVAGDDLEIERARRFLTMYRAIAPDLLPEALVPFVLPLVRSHLRYEIRRSIAAENRGEAVDLDYRAAEIRAFTQLQDVRLII